MIHTDKKRGKGSGFTLVEILIASFMALIIMGVIITVFIYARKAYDYAEFSYVLDEDVYAAVKWIKKDLAGTNLSTIWVISDDELDRFKHSKKEFPVLTLESAVDSKTGSFQFNKFGAPDWQKHVIYTFKANKVKQPGMKDIRVGTLYRYEKMLTDKEKDYNLPKMFEPGDMFKISGDLTGKRAILYNVVIPGQDLDLDGEKEKYHGFLVRFIRQKEEDDEATWFLSDVNPSRNDPDLVSQNTRLINVEITTLTISRATGKKNVFNISFMVNPRN